MSRPRPRDTEKQPTRLLKCQCEACGYTVRTTQKWLREGEPLCPIHNAPMKQESR